MSAAEKQPLLSANVEAAGGHWCSSAALFRPPWVAAVAVFLAACAAATAVYGGEVMAELSFPPLLPPSLPGGINLNCPKGMSAPTRRGPNPQFTVET